MSEYQSRDGRFSYYQVKVKLDVCEVALKQGNNLLNTYWGPYACASRKTRNQRSVTKVYMCGSGRPLKACSHFPTFSQVTFSFKEGGNIPVKNRRNTGSGPHPFPNSSKR